MAEKVPWFNPKWDWGSVLRLVGFAGTVLYFVLHLWSVEREQMIDMRSSINLLTAEVRNAIASQNDKVLSVRTETDIHLRALEARIIILESRQSSSDARDRETAAAFGALREQGAATLAAVGHLRDVTNSLLSPQRRLVK